jgi:hypothetical protein
MIKARVRPFAAIAHQRRGLSGHRVRGRDRAGNGRRRRGAVVPGCTDGDARRVKFLGRPRRPAGAPGCRKPGHPQEPGGVPALAGVHPLARTVSTAVLAVLLRGGGEVDREGSGRLRGRRPRERRGCTASVGPARLERSSSRSCRIWLNHGKNKSWTRRQKPIRS